MLTVVVRTLLFPITYRQVKSMRKMQELKPDMDRIKAEHKDDLQKQREEVTKPYQERQVNPLGSCLPIFVQILIFLVLYYTIRQFDKLDSFRTGGLFWFTDLTVADPLFILPAACVVTMMASQELAMRHTAAQQKQTMR
jgi:YidC/Oxa1 family membrane protein insertase